ncbi:unnamed protein product [Camellia sinensis]
MKRTGWVRRDVENPESIADHMYRMGLMALIDSNIPRVDPDKCIKMAIVHDIVEGSFVRMWRIARQKLGVGGFPVPRIQQPAVSALRCYSSATKEISFVRMWRIARQKLGAGGFPVPSSFVMMWRIARQKLGAGGFPVPISFVRMWRIARQKLGAGGFPVPSSYVRMWRIARQKLGAGGFPVPGCGGLQGKNLELEDFLFRF